MEQPIDNLLKDYKNQKQDTWIMNVMNLNMQLLEERQTKKAKSRLNKLAVKKVFMIILGIAWALFLAALAFFGSFVNLFFGISMAAIAVINIIVVALYIQHVVLILRINYSNSIVETQQKLSKLQLSTLTMTRIVFLQSPFWTTFFWQPDMAFFSDWRFFLIGLPIALLLTFTSVWMFRNVNIGNKDKKWFGWLFRGAAWSPIVEAQEFMQELADFKNE